MEVGTEWLIDASGCTPEVLRDAEALRGLCERVLVELELRVVGEGTWHRFGPPGGLTGLYLLTESHLACHTFPEYGSLCLNVFCCRPRPEWDFETELRLAVGATSVQVRKVDRPYR